MHLRYLPRAILLALPPALALLICTFPAESRSEFVFNPGNANLLRIYSSNYIHFNLSHCVSNIILYSLFTLAAYIVFRNCREESIFWKTFIACLLLVPLFSAISWMLVALAFPHLSKVNIYGFSAIASATIGIFGSGIAIYLSTLGIEKNFAFLAVLAFGLTVIPVIYGYTEIACLLLTLCLLSFLYRPTDRLTKREAVTIFVFFLLYQIGVQAMFPPVIFHGTDAVNLPAHYAGFSTGLDLLDSGRQGFRCP